MTTLQYLAALKKLGLTRGGKQTAAALGISMSTLIRLSVGKQKPSHTIELLLAMYLEHGMPLYLALPWR